jgi:hypothetical protein
MVISMKKKIAVGILAIAVIAIFMGNGIFAYFSDTESLAGNTFTAGRLDLTVEAENPWATAPIDVGPLAPGESITPVAIDLENVGNIDGDLYIRLTGVSTSTGVTIYPDTSTGPVSSEPEYLAEGATWDGASWETGSFSAIDNIDTVITLDCDYDGIDITNINGMSITTAVSNGWQLIDNDFGDVASGTVNFGAILDSSAGNEYQGDVISFTIEFYLAQDGQTP